MSHKYKLTYGPIKTHPEGLEKEAAQKLVEPDGGACDAILISSLMYPKDGSFSCMFLGIDGRTDKPLQHIEWFKVWVLLANLLSESDTLDTGRKDICGEVFANIKEQLLAQIKEEE
jgi:hypothetical protein